MPLTAGDKLGPYEILELIGKGGMGEVYRARDSRLSRDVAIKTSAAQFSERFEREAKAIAALNHPNICQLYDIGPNYLVMEYIEGEAPQGPLPLEEALRIARQICDALEAAHDKGITHRDLKPGNIKIKPDGTVKVLDFGLAKVEPGSAVSQSENSPTLSMAATQMGMILGTAGYMSPEQARGKAVDKRADIWAFGVVFYELLTGKRLFQGEDVSQTMAAVIMQEPNLDAVPVQVRKLLQRCLEKDPKKRLRDFSGVELLLESGTGLQPVSAPQAEARATKLAWVVVAVFVLAFAVPAFLHFRETPPPEQTTRYSITVPENSNIDSFALSPDGRTLVMAAAVNGKSQLYLRPMDALQFQPLPFTEDATYPFWSPDSRYIGFFAQGKLKKVAASGGPSLALCDAPIGRGGSWNRDDVIVFSPNSTSPSLQRVPAAGGVPADVVKSPGGYLKHPVFLPDGRHFLYTINNGSAEQNGIHVALLDQKADGAAKGEGDRRILPDVSGAQFAPPERSGQPGHLLFIRQKTLMAVPFDASSAQFSGDVFPLADGVKLNTTTAYAALTVSGNGILLYETGGVTGGNQLAWYDRTGKQLGAVGAPGAAGDAALSPDEKQVVFNRQSSTSLDLWVRDLSRGTETRFTSDPSNNLSPSWSPKGDRIVYSSNRRGGVFNLYQKAANGSGQDELLQQSNLLDLADQWSRDGRFIVFHRIDPKTKGDLWVLPMDSPVSERSEAERKPIPFLQSEFDERFGQLSPDSHWMAFASDRSGRREVYVRPFPPGEGEYPISIVGGDMPRWRGDGKELFFVGADGKMMAVPVKSAVVTGAAKPAFEAGAPVALFDAHMVGSGTSIAFEYDVPADGKRFLVNTIAGLGGGMGAAAPPLTVVTNWEAGLKK